MIQLLPVVDKVQQGVSTKKQIQLGDDPCKIVVIGLPYSGKDQVARILSQKYNCTLLKMPQLIKDKEEHKAIGQLCFNNYQGRSVIVLDPCNSKTLYHLKKRNFVNVIFIDAPFKKRLSHYCQKLNKQINLNSFQQFSNLDSDYQTKDYQKCHQYVRVRIFNHKGIQQLQKQIQANINEIIRPFRPSYDQYFMKMADIAKRRSNCMKSSVGCVIVNDNNRVVSTGFNGTPRGLQACFKQGCTRCNQNIERGLDQCLCLHGEQSAILQVGIARTTGCKLYTTLYPCFSCAKIIKQAGIKKIFFMQQYSKEDNGQKFLKQNYKQQDIVQIKVNNLYY